MYQKITAVSEGLLKYTLPETLCNIIEINSATLSARKNLVQMLSLQDLHGNIF